MIQKYEVRFPKPCVGGSNPPKRTRESTPKGVLFYLGSGLAPWACRPSIACERGGAGEQVQRVQWGWCGAFRHPEQRKTSCVKKWLI